MEEDKTYVNYIVYADGKPFAYVSTKEEAYDRAARFSMAGFKTYIQYAPKYREHF